MKKVNSLYRTVLLSCIGMILVHMSSAQQTGSFDRKITFKGIPGWVLSYYVPPSYNAAKKYKLCVSLHGLGDNPQNMRNFLANNIEKIAGSTMYNAIIVCPYGGGYTAPDTTRDYTDWWTTCDTSIITRCITEAKSGYNIAPDSIYLSGISIGGRAALRYGLLNYRRFRGLELWCPAVQNLNEANNLTSFTYPWQNGQYIPITISVGGSDGYYGILPIAYQHLSDAGALVNYQIYYGMGHEMPKRSGDYIRECNYINSNATSYVVNDAMISNIASPIKELCSTSFTPIVTIQNKGVNNLTSAIINYQIDNGTINTYNWAGNLIQLGRNKVTLLSQSVSAGAHTFKAYTTMPNGVADAVPSNDSMTVNFNNITKGIASISESFKGTTFPPAGWYQTGTDVAWGWGTGAANLPFIAAAFENLTYFPAGPSGNYLIYFDNNLPVNRGKYYSIHTPQCDFTNSNKPTLTYYYAYAPAVGGTDTLVVYYSTDCGSTWNTLLKKGGLDLSTTGGYEPANSFLVPTSVSQWKQETIDLNLPGLIGQPEVMFSFENRCNQGHMLYISNIDITPLTGIVNETHEPVSVNIYPNPAKYNITIESPQQTAVIEISNLEGQLIKTIAANGNKTSIDVSAFPNGLYFVKVRTEKGIAAKKFIKE